MRLHSQHRCRDRGASAVEFALVSIPLFALLLGIIAFGVIFFNQIMVTQAARAGARSAAICGQDASCFLSLKAKIKANVAGIQLQDSEISITQCALPVVGTISSASVTVKYPVTVPGPIGTITLTGKSSMPCGY